MVVWQEMFQMSIILLYLQKYVNPINVSNALSEVSAVVLRSKETNENWHCPHNYTHNLLMKILKFAIQHQNTSMELKYLLISHLPDKTTFQVPLCKQWPDRNQWEPIDINKNISRRKTYQLTLKWETPCVTCTLQFWTADWSI